VLETQPGLLALGVVYTVTNLLEHAVAAWLAYRAVPGLRISPKLIDRETLHRVKGYRLDSFLAMLAGRITVQPGAIVIGGFDDQDLREFLGYDLGVAITGSEEKGITLVVTEGFGEIPMAGRTFELLKACEGRKVSVSGATQIRAGVLHPEIICPRLEADLKSSASEASSGEAGLTVGCQIRIIRQPFFGRLGIVTSLPPEPTALETEAKVRVLEVDFGGGERAFLPRANVERIES